MRRLWVLTVALVAASFVSGCGSGDGVGKATEEDRKNIERLAREGVGAPRGAEEEAK
ncbi:MAG: hypothetical protein N2109_02305 [Fimbriimonadales bacterium]|nr:hypothetical protein [Fimbriimonadales bacterium]